MMFLDDLKAYLTTNGYKNISTDNMPDQPDECIGLILYANAIGGGSCTRRVQIQVRRYATDDAYADADAIMRLLDSGSEETKIQLTTERWCIGRPTAGAKKLTADDRRMTYYTEVSIFGEDTP